MFSGFKEFMEKVEVRKYTIEKSTCCNKQEEKDAAFTNQYKDWYIPRELPWEQLSENLQEADACKFFDGYLPITSHRKILGKGIVFCKKAVRKLIKIFLGWYIFPQYERLSHFHGKIVNVASLERDILISTVEQGKITAEQLVEYQKKVNGQLSKIYQEIASLREQLAEQEDRLRKIEDTPINSDDFYHDFEEKFRGSQEDIKERLHMYIPILNEYIRDWSKGTFVDLGSGRGEWMDILRENGAVDYVGIDLNTRQNALCEAKNHRVKKTNCVTYLSTLPANSVDLITGFHIIEHLYISDLITLLKESYRVLKPGGVVLFETPNSRNLIVGADTFYIDPSHRRPVNPRTMSFLVEWSGFEKVRHIDANACENCQALDLPDPEEHPMVYRLTKEFNDVKWLLYGPQDYAVLGVKKGDAI